VTLLGETWERFPKGILPLSFLKDLGMALEESAQFRRQEDLGPCSLWGEETAPDWHTARVSGYQPRKLTRLGERELEILIEHDLERLLRTLLLPSQENEGRKEALLGMIGQLGQVYHLCRRRWKKERARELVWGGVQRVCLRATQAVQLIERGKQAEASRKARQAEQEVMRVQALALVGDYAI
jgi:hypothetical protein